MNLFEIKSEQGFLISFSDRAFDTKDMISHYSATLCSPTMTGSVRVYNAPYGTTPLSFFQSIDNEWQGWKGEKGWGAIEGELDLIASSDNTGHITIKARIFSGYGPPSAKMEIECIVESGQTRGLAEKAKLFFNN